MRKIIYFFLFGILIACTPTANYHHQLEQVESIIEDNPDSARLLLEKISPSLLGLGEERALYNLLLTMADYKLYKPFADDSLVRFSVDFYTQNGETNYLTEAYYYIGAINYDELKQKDVAINYLKKAEEHLWGLRKYSFRRRTIS